jgi:hypothetical protein
MFNKTNEELKAEGYNRAKRRIILGINKKGWSANDPVPSWRLARQKAGKIVNV